MHFALLINHFLQLFNNASGKTYRQAIQPILRSWPRRGQMIVAQRFKAGDIPVSQYPSANTNEILTFLGSPPKKSSRNRYRYCQPQS
jgi:hypothetical protein